MRPEEDSILRFAEGLAKKAGDFLIAQRRDKSFSKSYKADRDLLTSADKEAERLIIDSIHRSYPGHHIIAEESSPDLSHPENLRGPLWIIDPIDGTVNFIHGQPQVGVSIAFAQGGEVTHGVVNAPFSGEMFAARKGHGAYLNGKHIHTSNCDNLKTSLIATGFPANRDHVDEMLVKLRKVLVLCQDVRRIGAASVDICWVACGRLDGFYESLKPWDIAAGALVVREAGGLTGTTDQSLTGMLPMDLYSSNFVAACPGIFGDLCEMLSGPPSSP